MLKSCLQVLVLLIIALRCIALFGRLRRSWTSSTAVADPLWADFHSELRRRGLFTGSTLPRGGDDQRR